MRDWEALVDTRLAGLALDPAERAEVIAELGAHLEDACDGLQRRGMTEEEAVQRTLSQVEDWQNLRRKIQTVRTKENIMNDRVRQLWLPGLVTLLLWMGIFVLIQIFGPSHWIVARKSVWSHIVPAAVIYILLMLSLPVLGAMGAYLSVSAGGSRRAVICSTVFPVSPYLVVFIVAVPAALIADGNIIFTPLLVGLFAWVIFPGVALLAGGSLVQIFVSGRLDSRRIVGS